MASMTPANANGVIMHTLDAASRSLVRLAALVAGGSEAELRSALARESANVPVIWMEELILQSYLFSGFPRALNAMREWRRLHPVAVSRDVSPDVSPDMSPDVGTWRDEGRATCRAVYGSMYERLRENVRTLHPLLDDWMITEGYGKVLSRAGLDLPRRELCIVAACAASGQDRQLHSHLHGARNVGVAPAVIGQAIEALADLLHEDRLHSLRLLWARVKGK